jgi:hypothetical protein
MWTFVFLLSLKPMLAGQEQIGKYEVFIRSTGAQTLPLLVGLLIWPKAEITLPTLPV